MPLCSGSRLIKKKKNCEAIAHPDITLTGYSRKRESFIDDLFLIYWIYIIIYFYPF